MGRRKVLIGVVALAAVGMLMEAARAGSPFITDDPIPQGKGHIELDIASEGIWAKQESFTTLPHVEFDYGITDHFDFHILAPMVYDRPDNTGGGEYGYGDTELGFKWEFFKEDQLFTGCPEAGIYPLVELDTGNHSRGLGNGRDQAFIPLWLLKSWGEKDRPWTIYGGGGYWLNPGNENENYGFFGVALQKQLTEHLNLGGELFHATVAAKDESAHTGFNLGGIYDFNEHWHLLISAGCDLKGDNRLTDYLGVQYTF